MPDYGIVKDGALHTSKTPLDGYKPLEYADIPVFNQETEYVAQGEITESETLIVVGYEVKRLTLDDELQEPEMPATEFVELEPWDDKDPEEVKRENEMKLLETKINMSADRADVLEDVIAEMIMTLYQ